MATANKNRKILPKRNGIQSGPKHRSKRISKSITQSGNGKSAKRSDKLQKKSGLQLSQAIQTPTNTGELNLNRLNLDIKIGFDILKNYGGQFIYSSTEKLKALMLYSCLKVLPEFVDKQFHNLSDAITYIYKQTHLLIGDQYGIIYDKQAVDEMGYPTDDLKLQIVYDKFEPTDARWQSYMDVDPSTEGKPDLRKALYMCLHLIINEFGFSCFDYNGGESVMSLSDWAEGEQDACDSEIESCHERFIAEFSRDFTHSEDDYKTDIGKSLLDAEERYAQLQTAMEIDKTVAAPLRNRIQKIKPNLKFLKSIANKYSKQQVGNWIEHIIMLTENKFTIHKYIGEAYLTDDTNQMGIDRDDEYIGPTSAYGFIYDGDNIYAKAVNEDYNSYAQNYEIVPFVIHKTIIPGLNKIFKTEDVPLGDWINKIFRFDFKKLKYEID